MKLPMDTQISLRFNPGKCCDAPANDCAVRAVNRWDGGRLSWAARSRRPRGPTSIRRATPNALRRRCAYARTSRGENTAALPTIDLPPTSSPPDLMTETKPERWVMGICRDYDVLVVAPGTPQSHVLFLAKPFKSIRSWSYAPDGRLVEDAPHVANQHR